MSTSPFTPAPVFTPAGPAFLAALAADNSKAWFEAHRRDYEAAVLAPMRALAEALGPAALAIDPQVETRPGRVVSRIHRDVRFSKDKSPYRITSWITFKRPAADWADAPALFVEVGPAGWRTGMGFYGALPATMARLRQAVAADPAAFAHAATTAAGAGLEPAGESYRRPTREAVALPQFKDWLDRKSPYAVRTEGLEALFAPGLETAVAAAFRATAPLYRFFRRAHQADERA